MALLDRLRRGSGFIPEVVDEGILLIQPDGARLVLSEEVTYKEKRHGPNHRGGVLSPLGLHLLDQWVLFPPGKVGLTGWATVPQGLPLLVSTRDLYILNNDLEIAERTLPPNRDRMEGILLFAASIISGAREAGLEELTGLWKGGQPSFKLKL
ncbi:hypothetical protein H8D30_01410 [bacterium]|nr:hypothetical protein [bacterium]